MPKSDISVNTSPVASRYTNEKVIEFSSPVGGGLISFVITPDNQLSVHVYRQDLTVRVTAGEEDEPVRHGNTRADQALYEAARAFTASWEASHPQPDPDAEDVARLTALAAELGASELVLDEDVHDMASSVGSDVNNGGMPAQVKYLVEMAGAAEAEQMIRAAAEDD